MAEELPPPRPAAGRATPQRGGTLHLAIIDDVRSLDPAIAYDEFSAMAERLVFDQLVGYELATGDTPLELRPMLAESWDLSKDGRILTFKLREGLRYHDGQPIEADDFVYAIERIQAPDSGSPAAQFFAGVEQARAIDARTLEIRLSQPDPSFLLVMAMPFGTPVKRSWGEKYGERLRDNPIVSGPYSVASWEEGSRIVFVRNPRYWDVDQVYLDRIEVDLMVDRDTAVLRFLRGELDSVERLSSDKYLQFKRSEAWREHVTQIPGMNVYGEHMDVTRAPFNDKRVRQAMNYALRKEDTIKLYNGRAILAHGALPPGLVGRNPRLKPYPYDPAKAKALLAEAGYPNGFTVTYTTTKDELAEKIAESIQSDLAEVGIRVQIQLVTFPTYLTAIGRGELQFAYTAWVMDFPDPWNFIEVLFHSRYISDENSSNATGFENGELDALLDAARRELDPEKRARMYERAEEILYDECPWIWHYHSITTEIVQPYVANYRYHPVYQRDYRYAWLDR